MKNLIFLVSILFCSSLLASQTAVYEINVKNVRGEVSVKSKRLNKGDKIKVGDLVEVAKSSFVTLVLPNSSVMRMGPGKIKIAEYESKKKTTVNLIKGTVFTFVKGLAKGEKFNIKTKQGSMGVRGTKFLVMENGPDSYLCVCEGEVIAKNNYRKKVSVKAGQDLHMNDALPFQVVNASNQMMQMGVKTFKEMGFPVKGY